ncbi:hypothetical protein [Achromobacter marplatensis]|uniref:hypothetical protein n=1 Tax=Achromobacter marplatensis TaxID=470868 RepID=UPI000277FA01|nr:hypothetical protein [Achromobacter marplatensis]EJO27518.1 hypothetical protein QWC_31423 [Achromobacter marplatensis]
MSPEEIEAIAQRPTCCKAWDETVSLTKAERDALVAMARDGARYQWLRDQTETDGIAIVMKDKYFDKSRTCAENIDKFVDAEMAKESP